MDEKLVEAVARIIDPQSWIVMDSELARMLRKYRGQNVGWPSDQFQHKESMARARAILPIAMEHAAGIAITFATAMREHASERPGEPEWQEIAEGQARMAVDIADAIAAAGQP